mmetsp:Transcript_962/g.2359  ORF Transcript_962/g.2359 Transcript_962/m.2359 type:complete len:83 (-) Transcript_962:1417-1665(-)
MRFHSQICPPMQPREVQNAVAAIHHSADTAIHRNADTVTHRNADTATHHSNHCRTRNQESSTINLMLVSTRKNHFNLQEGYQ